MHFLMDSTCCQEEMDTVKCMNKGIKGIESRYFLQNSITVLYTSMSNAWSFSIFINKDIKLENKTENVLKIILSRRNPAPAKLKAFVIAKWHTAL